LQFIMDMQFVVDSGAERRMGEFFAGIGAILANKRRRESFAIYAMGCSPMASARARNRWRPALAGIRRWWTCTISDCFTSLGIRTGVTSRSVCLPRNTPSRR